MLWFKKNNWKTRSLAHSKGNLLVSSITCIRWWTYPKCLLDLQYIFFKILKKLTSYCIYQIASGGYYGFRFVTLPQFVERFHHYHSNEKNIIAILLKFAGYIHNHKILPGNIFGFILKNKMAATGVFFSTFSKDFWWPSRGKGIIGRDLKCAGYVSHYKILTGNIFGLILKNKRWLPRAFLCQS